MLGYVSSCLEDWVLFSICGTFLTLQVTVQLQICGISASHRVYYKGDLSSRLSISADESTAEALALGSVPSWLGCLECSYVEHLHSPGNCATAAVPRLCIPGFINMDTVASTAAYMCCCKVAEVIVFG